MIALKKARHFILLFKSTSSCVFINFTKQRKLDELRQLAGMMYQVSVRRKNSDGKQWKHMFKKSLPLLGRVPMWPAKCLFQADQTLLRISRI